MEAPGTRERVDLHQGILSALGFTLERKVAQTHSGNYAAYAAFFWGSFHVGVVPSTGLPCPFWGPSRLPPVVP